MLLADTLNAIGAAVTGAIRQAAQVTGTGFSYLLATAKIESGLNPQSKSSTSSATGLFQFIDQTWLMTMKQSGAELGYGRYADAIQKTASGRYVVADPAMRAEILALRKNPAANAAMAGALTRQNATTLRRKIGRDPTEGELYIAHFLGAGGASKLINAAAQSPGVKATQLFPRAAAANRSIFYDKQGNARSVTGVYGLLVTKLARAMPAAPQRLADAWLGGAVPPAGSAASSVLSPTRTADAVPVIPMPPLAASIAPLMVHPSAPPLAATPEPQAVSALAPPVGGNGQVFYDLFRTEGRGAVSKAVSELWGVHGANAATADGAAANGGESGRPAGQGFDLFRSAAPST